MPRGYTLLGIFVFPHVYGRAAGREEPIDASGLVAMVLDQGPGTRAEAMLVGPLTGRCRS
jgi:hypothetical protein